MIKREFENFLQTVTVGNTRTNKLYVEGFDDYVLTEMINMLCNE